MWYNRGNIWFWQFSKLLKIGGGAHYYWLAAIAKNDDNYSAADMTALETAGAEATYSICPKGWRLPLRNNGMIAVKNMYSLDDFRKLWNQGQTGSAPLAGYYYDSTLNNSGSNTDWLSRESHSATGARTMYQNSSGFSTNYSLRLTGLSVRCVLEVPQTFQNFTSADAASLAEDQTTTLMDTRDGKQYLVTKLKDGNVWMTQNLALEGGTTITPADSDVRAAYTLPESNTSGFDDPAVAFMYNGSHKDNSGDNKDTTNTGAYYSWLTAIATSDNSTADGNYTIAEKGALRANAQAAYSICPKGWRLPRLNSGTVAVRSMYSTDDFRALWNHDVVGTAPLVGNYRDNSYTNVGLATSWWTREADSLTSARYEFQNASGFGAYNHDSRKLGNSVRCVFEP